MKIITKTDILILMTNKLCILPLFLTALFTSCSPAESEQLSKNTHSEYKINIDEKIMWSNCLSQIEDHYLVFFYSDTCTHCHEIMGDVLSFKEANILKMYFLNLKEQDVAIPISNDIDFTIGVDSVDDLSIAGTPSIIEVETRIVKANVAGSDNCLTFLNEQRLKYKN